MGNLKLSAEEIAEEATYTPDPYGYGTRIYLKDEQIEAAAGGACKVGQRVRISGWATVTSTSMREEETKDGKEMCRSLELQITDMEIMSQSDPAETAKSMYPTMS